MIAYFMTDILYCNGSAKGLNSLLLKRIYVFKNVYTFVELKSLSLYLSNEYMYLKCICICGADMNMQNSRIHVTSNG